MQIRFKVVLELSKKSVDVLMAFGNTVITAINTTSATFTTPHPPLASCSSALADLSTAAALADNGKGSVLQVETQRVMRIAFETLITELGHYVEDVANDPANAVPLNHPVEIIESAGMTVKRVTIPTPRVFSAKTGEMPGTATLVAGFVRRGTHDWQYSLTPLDESSWTSVPSTTRAKTVIEDLTSLSRYYFRHRAILKSGATDWDEPVSAVID